MKLLNIDEEVPEVFYVFVGQGYKFQNQVNYHNYKLDKRIKSSGFQGIIAQPELVNNFINGNIDYAPYIPSKTTLSSISSHCLSILNHYQVEYVLEYYRKLNYPTYPSRFSCVYAFGSYDDCVKANRLYKWDLNQVKKFKLLKTNTQLDNCIKVAKCNMEIVTMMWENEVYFCNNNSINDVVNEYWLGGGQIAFEHTDIETNLRYQKVSDVLYEYLIEGILEEVE